MRYFFNTLLHGDAKTKRIFWAMTICILSAVVLAAAALFAGRPSWFAPALILVAAAVILSQQYDFRQIREDMDEAADISPEDILVYYNEKRLRQVFVRFHVKEDHRPVIIDSSEKYHIKETPAYVWVFRRQFHILLIDKQVRELVFPLAEVTTVTYRRGVPVNVKGEYIQLRKPSLLAKVFSDYLPDTYERGTGGIRQQFKNLYVIGDDIALTAKSMKHIFALTGANFKLDDKLTQSGEFSEDFIDMYTAYTLFRDQVIDAEQYKKKVTAILDDMAVSNMLDQELMLNLEKMKNFRFLTEDYANYCMEKRVKYKNEQNRKHT